MIFPSFLSIFTGFCLSLLIACIAYYFKFLSKSGALAAVVVGGIVFGLGGLAHTAVLLTFFFSSSILSVILKKQKQQVNEKYAKGSRRDAGQVLANGGVATSCVIVGAFFPDQPIFWWMFCAAFAAANADTWATEIGVLSKYPPRLLTSFKQVEMGTSGGITLLGSASALAGAGLIAGIAAIFRPEMIALLLIALAGFFGSFVDSLLGATVQGIYYCETCQKETEKHPKHTCGGQTTIIRGWKWLNNDWVNMLCTLSAVVFILIFYFGITR
jgi:uncharacterized protein (TIGR00297 family)